MALALHYPVSIALTPTDAPRNRLTVAFRLVLALPHNLLVGGINLGSSGLLGSVAAVCALVSWFAILFTGRDIPGL